DPKHRNRLAFVKIVSGTFEKNKAYMHVRLGKNLKFSSPNAFFAEKKEIVDISYAVFCVNKQNTGNFKIGDTLTEGEKMQFKGIQMSSPQHGLYSKNAVPMQPKRRRKGLDQPLEYGVVQLLTLEMRRRKGIRPVRALRNERFQFRFQPFYGGKCRCGP